MSTAAAPTARPHVRAAMPRRAPDVVVEWRFDELERAGYDGIRALTLALAPGVDLEGARRLLAQGCPPAVAVRILL